MTVTTQLLELDSTQAEDTLHCKHSACHKHGRARHGDNLQARNVAEQSLTERAESGMSRWGESKLQRTLTGMLEQSRSERPQSKQHASLIFL